ncbi:MAG: FMN-binding protein [Faecalibacterium sp.]|jgi:electron transport complex protein RnfG|nr:FMN-binding protein [Faecalibacterium sp.]
MNDAKNKQTWEEIVKPIVVLSVISLVVSALLAIVNTYTEPVIEANEKAVTLAAYVDVMPTVSDAKTLDEVKDFTTENVEGVVKSADGCYAVKAVEKGFDGGELSVIVGFGADGAITGVYVDASTQTKGIGTHVSDEDYLQQFYGLDGTQNLTMGEGVDGYSGATYSSKALFAALNDCVNCYNEVAGAM